MPIATKNLFKCTSCGFKTYRTIGDRLPDANMLKPCPVCAAKMQMVARREVGKLDNILGSLGKVLDSFKK